MKRLALLVIGLVFLFTTSVLAQAPRQRRHRTYRKRSQGSGEEGCAGEEASKKKAKQKKKAAKKKAAEKKEAAEKKADEKKAADEKK